jgi:hypothetical protein
MKIILFMMLFYSNAIHAEEKKTEQTKNEVSGISKRDQACILTLKAQVTAQNLSEIKTCKSYKKIAALNGESLESGAESKASSDKKVTCVRKAGYTMDYQSCAGTLAVYNVVTSFESTLATLQQLRTTQSQTKLTQEVNQKMASGDTQNAVLNASVTTNRQQSEMNVEQAAAYTAAVAALGTKISGWTGSNLGDLQKKCAGQVSAVSADGTEPQCTEAMSIAYTNARSDLFANDSARAFFISALTTYIAKGVAAGIKAKQLSGIADATAAATAATATDSTTAALYEKCVLEPTSTECLTTSATTSGTTFTSGDYSLGDGTSNSFDLTGTTDTTAVADAATTETTPIASVNSPFNEEAKKAHDILNPADAANSSGGSSPSSSGGGGGGGLGGGSASLGGDLSGQDKSATNSQEIKVSKQSGNYAASSGGGFQGVKSTEESANPFSGLFDAKASEAIEEFDSAQGIDHQSSDLFKKISDRYSKVQSENRIEANNLE